MLLKFNQKKKNISCSCSAKTTKKDPSLLKVPREVGLEPWSKLRPSVGPGPDRPEGKFDPRQRESTTEQTAVRPSPVPVPYI